MNDVVPVENALMSVFYKEGIVDMAKILIEKDVRICSSGGTATALRDAGLPVIDVADYTGFPALFGHRVVTLHPKVHGGILYRRDVEQDVREAREHNIVSIGLVVVNLYPVEEAIAAPNATIDGVVEKTDIGGPALIRAAAKNHKFVGAVVDPKDYIPVAEMIKDLGGLTFSKRQELAAKAFRRTAEYDNAIADFYENNLGLK